MKKPKGTANLALGTCNMVTGSDGSRLGNGRNSRTNTRMMSLNIATTECLEHIVGCRKLG